MTPDTLPTCGPAPGDASVASVPTQLLAAEDEVSAVLVVTRDVGSVPTPRATGRVECDSAVG